MNINISMKINCQKNQFYMLSLYTAAAMLKTRTINN